MGKILTRWRDSGCVGGVDPAPASFSREIFATRFCRHFGVPPERFASEMLRRSLYPHARLVYYFASPEAFAADREFIASVGQLTRRRDLAGESVEFHDDPRNRHFWRRYGRLRVSVHRVQALFNAAWK